MPTPPEDDVFVAASRHEHLVVYDPAAIPVDTPFDRDMRTGEPHPIPAATLKALAAEGRALVLHFPVEDCEARVRIVMEPPSSSVHERGRLVLERSRLSLPGGRAIADGAEFIHGDGQTREHAQERGTSVTPGDYAVSVLNLIPWKEANRAARLAEATTPAGRRMERLTSVIALTGAVLIPLNVLLAPVAIAVAWKSRGFRTAAIVTGCIVAVDALVLGAAAILQTLKRRYPVLDEAPDARLAFERENPDVVLILEPWSGGDAKAAWATLDVK